MALSPLVASAGVPSQQVMYASSHIEVPFSGYSDAGNCKVSCLGFTSLLMGSYTGITYISNTWANYTDFSLGSSSAPQQSFAVGMEDGMANLSAINSNNVEFLEAGSASTPSYLHFQYVMPPGNTYIYPQNVVIGSNTLGYPYQSASGLTACTAPCAYLDQANRTMIIKTQQAAAVTDIWYTPCSGCGGGGPVTSTSTNGGGGGNTPGTVSATQTTTGSFTTSVINTTSVITYGGPGGYTYQTVTGQSTITVSYQPPVVGSTYEDTLGLVAAVSVFILLGLAAALRRSSRENRSTGPRRPTSGDIHPFGIRLAPKPSEGARRKKQD